MGISGLDTALKSTDFGDLQIYIFLIQSASLN